jgi:dipeptidyl aminopeptidase/acylaminoacyl peptidase
MRAVCLAIALAACGGGGGANAPTTPKPTTGAGSVSAARAAPAKPAAVVHAQGHPSDTVTPRYGFFQNPVNTSAKLSPDGKRLVWLQPRNNVALPVLSPIDDLKAATPIATDTTRPVTSVFWTPDGNHLIYVQDPNGDGNTHVFRYDLADGKTTDLVPIKGARVDLLGMGPRAPDRIIVGINDRDPQWDDIYQLSLKTGEKKRLVQNTEHVAQFSLDDDLVPRMGTKQLPDGSEQLVQLTAKGESIVWDTIPANERDTTKFLGIDPTGTTGWMVDSRGRDTAAVFAVDLKTKKRKLLAEDPHVDAISGFIDPVTLELAGVGFNDLKGAWKLVAPRLAPDAAALDAISGGMWELTSATKDGKQWLVQVATDTQPGIYYLYDRTTKKARRVMAETPALDDMVLSPMQALELKARDGQRLVAYATVPREHDPERRGVPDRPLPAVLLIGPDPTQRLAWTYNSIHQWLSSRGYVVITTNTRGANGFGKAFASAGSRQWGRAMEDDLVDVVRALIDRKIVDPQKVCIAGVSYGGYAALIGLERERDLFACAIDVLGPTDLVTAAKLIPAELAPMYAQRIGDPTTDAGIADLRQISPVEHSDAITKPVLVIATAEHGMADQSKRLVDALVKRGAPVSYLTFPDEPAAEIDKPGNNYAMLGVFEAFLSEQLGGPFEPLPPDARAQTSLTAVVGGERVPGL